MQHDFDASAALLEQVNHALNSATPLRIQGSGSKAHLGRATRVRCWIPANIAASSAMTPPSWC